MEGGLATKYGVSGQVLYAGSKVVFNDTRVLNSKCVAGNGNNLAELISPDFTDGINGVNSIRARHGNRYEQTATAQSPFFTYCSLF